MDQRPDPKVRGGYPANQKKKKGNWRARCINGGRHRDQGGEERESKPILE